MSERRDIFQALENGDLVLRYQPIVELSSRKPVSVEALLHGHKNDRRAWNITDLTTSAEHDKSIFDLEAWIFDQACRDAASWQSVLPDLEVNINVSALEFQNKDFLPMLEDTTEKSGLQPSKINIEITETASIHEGAIASQVVSELQRRGYDIWLDDFGTGHSSLEWLKWFPAASLKIPSVFVRDITSDRSGRAIVHAVTMMARELGIAVVAEGVENQEQLEILTEYGVRLFQGFFFYQPLSIEELTRTLTSERRIR